MPPPFPPHVAEDVKESRALYNLVKEQGATAPPASSRARRASRTSSSPRSTAREHAPEAPGRVHHDVPAEPEEEKSE